MTKVDDWVHARAFIEVAQSHVRSPKNQSPSIEQAIEYIEELGAPHKEEAFSHFIYEVKEIVGRVEQEIGPTLDVGALFGNERNLLRILDLLFLQENRPGIERI